jgi:asparagine synthase (glutamine-hydrolysing)
MCGIAGMFMRGGAAADGAVLQALADAIHHRGPDSTDLWCEGSVGLLSDRLAIMDLEGGNQPLYGPKGSVLVANGEIYNNPDLRAELAGHTFKTGSDCEPAAHLYERDGVGYAKALRGMYAIAIWDPALKRLVVSRDPFGIKPLYYLADARGFFFASEPQALVGAGLVAAEVSEPQRDELLQLKYTVGRPTIFKGIERFLPGETLVIEDGQIVERLRLSPLPAPVGRTKPDQAVAAFEQVMTDSVEQHLHTDVPYGLFLSGGIDSSILLLLMQRLSKTSIQAITVGYAGQAAVDESRAALDFAKRHGADCHRVEMSEQDFFTLAPRIAAAIDDPTCDAAVLPTWTLGRAARTDGLKVTLCGEGADELFAGYRRYRPNPLKRLRAAKPRKGVFDKSEGVKIPERWRAGIEAAAATPPAGWSGTTQRLQALDVAEWLPNDLLVKLDRCLMIHSVEGRTPYLDPKVAAFAATLPDSLKIAGPFGGDLGKLLPRRWLAQADPRYPAMAKKRGFNTPVGGWIAARAPQIAPLVARQPGVAALFDAAAVEAIIGGAEKRDQPAWSLLFYALWHSTRIVGISAEGDIAAVLAAAAR